MLDYFYKVTDDYSCNHSIDKVIVNFALKGSSESFLKKIINGLHDIKEKYNCITYREKLNLEPQSKYSWFRHFISFDYGLPVFLGSCVYPDKMNKTFDVLPFARIEFNPNKSKESEYLITVIQYLSSWSFDIEIVRVDYAIDIPIIPEDVIILQSRKERTLIKDTRYLGQRSAHGRVKIYNKQKESNLDYNLTRLEFTIDLRKKFIMDKFLIVNRESYDLSTLSKLNLTLVRMCIALRESGLDYNEYIKDLEPRKRRLILSCIGNTGRIIEFDEMIFKNLIDKIKDSFYLFVPDQEDEPYIKTDNYEYNPFEDIEEQKKVLTE